MTSQNSIDQLLLCHHTDDPAIIEEIVRSYHAKIRRLALSFLDDPDEAEDATQETFITATMKLDQYEVGTNFNAWLYKVAVNTCRMQLRKKKTRRGLTELLTSAQLVKEKPIHPEEAALRDEAKVRLWDAVHQLGFKHRTVIILRVANQLSIPEIAKILGIREKTVYTRIYDAYRKLRHILGEEHYLFTPSRADFRN
jgi:RNA polymerase sigma-70 factor (ECF subfamily)